MPPPIPLSGAGTRYSPGSQSGSASRLANRGLIASQASSGEAAPAIATRTSATKARTVGVSRTNSFSIGRLFARRSLPRQQEVAVDNRLRDVDKLPPGVLRTLA